MDLMVTNTMLTVFLPRPEQQLQEQLDRVEEENTDLMVSEVVIMQLLLGWHQQRQLEKVEMEEEMLKEDTDSKIIALAVRATVVKAQQPQKKKEAAAVSRE